MIKKITLSAMVAFMTVATSNAANVYVEKSYNLYQMTDAQYNTLNLDGVGSEEFWNMVPFEEINIVQANPGDDPINPNGYSAKFKALYDEYSMYLLIEVADNSQAWYNGSVGLTACDIIELFYSQAPREALTSEARDANGSQLRLHPGYTSVPNFVSGGRFAGSNIIDGQLSGCEYVTTPTATGYVVEAIIPWDGVIGKANLNIKEGATVLFDINPANVEVVGGDRKCILSWGTTDYNAWKYNRQYGNLVLKGVMDPTGIKNVEENATVSVKIIGTSLYFSGVEKGTTIKVFDLAGKQLVSTVYNGTSVNLNGFTNQVCVVKVGGKAYKVVVD